MRLLPLHGGLVLLGVCLFVCACVSTGDPAVPGVDKLMQHNDRQRSGWNRFETILTPDNVADSGLELKWESPQLDSYNNEAPRIFASPLYVSELRLEGGPHDGESTAVVIAATGTGYLYAINAGEHGDIPPGEILWSRRLTTEPCVNGREAVLGTPVIDAATHRVYVVSCDNTANYQVHAFDLGSGKVAPGWPVEISHATINVPGMNRNGPTEFPDRPYVIQRGALNLNGNGTRLYVPFGKDTFSGWLVSVDTIEAKVASAFSTTAVTAEHQGGMWAASGTAVDEQGRVYIATGASVVFAVNKAGIAGVFPDSDHNWGQSILQLNDGPAGFELAGTFTPFDYCRAQSNDIDLGSSGTLVIDLDPAQTSTPRLLALVGGKQGNAFLLDRDNMPGSLVRRHPCSDDSTSDLSLLPPEDQPQFGQRGPLNVFGPYSADLGWYDYAKSRTTAAYYHDGAGHHYLYAAGNTKVNAESVENIPPSLVRLAIVTEPGKPAYLSVDRQNLSQVFLNPGSPVISSNGVRDAIIWVLDMNATRAVSPWDADNPPQPVLYAMDGETLEVLWRSRDGELHTSGKYNEPAVVNGRVIVGTDRIQVFGLKTGKD